MTVSPPARNAAALTLPPSPLDELIDQLGGSGQVGLYPIYCHFSVQLNHFIPVLLSHSVAVFLK
jgi:hypothetical protein